MSVPPPPLLNILRADGTPATGSRRMARRTPPRLGEACDLCGVPIGDRHDHLVDLAGRSLLCACRGCYLLFLPEGAAHGRYRPVPDRYVAVTHADESPWDLLDIPIGLAFFFVNSSIGHVAALYPSPAGATESTLPLDAWSDVVRSSPELATLAPDVEALLVRRMRGQHEMFIVPIDACYELVGIIRRDWKGFDGGDIAARAIDAFFDRVRGRSATAAVS
jgi:hypothetical protein